MNRECFDVVEEEIANIRESFKKIDTQIKKVVRTGDSSALRDLRAKASEYSLVPPVSHSFSTVFVNSFSKSFKFQRMINSSLMASTVSSRNAINSKSGGKAFCTSLGVSVPETYLTNIPTPELVHVDYSCFGDSFVIKPVFGAQSKNVFGIALQPDGSVLEVFKQKKYKNLSDALSAIANTAGRGMKWEVEQLVLDGQGQCSYDVKFYTFYGKVVLVLQVARWGKKREDVFFERTGNIVEARIERSYKPGSPVSFPLFSQHDIEQVERLSLQIPFPFSRIDFLAGKDKLYFGEFTFNAGGAAGFFDEWDRVLGEEFQAAQNRLMKDLLDGKKFDAYKQIVM
ncbi:ATP-grasp fold amidoligase family protein [Vreelandella lutescens]|uniref:Uncharacterized protein n=1 Tax=Vreelandella lutescens TaxID=1602943 RepID=A0ABQ1PMZ3_9GAMM|nr:ATP-grasp fold amidoligase family protein [Halomonas lutescens]GGC99828.1 hypothetical protein GCM10011382_32940 [Halomonas lutescens]